MTDSPYLDEAQQVREWLRVYPDQHTAGEIAEGTELDISVVREVLDCYRPEEGALVYKGPGQGGPWIELPEEDD